MLAGTLFFAGQVQAGHANYNVYGTPPFIPQNGRIIIQPQPQSQPYYQPRYRNRRYRRVNQRYHYDNYQRHEQDSSYGCPVVDDPSDYDAEWKQTNYNLTIIRDAQRRVGRGTCKILKLTDYKGRPLYVAVDRDSVRWATKREISNYRY